MQLESVRPSVPLLVLALACAIGLAGCQDSTNVVEPPTCTNRNPPEISQEDPLGHNHVLQGALCEEDRGNGVDVLLTAPDHTHTYRLLSKNVDDILDGDWFGTRTTLSMDHRHTIVYNPRTPSE